MREQRSRMLKKIQISIGVLFIIEVLVLSIYPFPNRDLTIKFITPDREYAQTMKSDEIVSGATILFSFPEKKMEILKVELYGKFSSMDLAKIETYEFARYISQGKVDYREDSIVLEADKDIDLVMDQAFNEFLESFSTSFLQERILLIEIALIVCVLSLCILHVLEEKLLSDIRANFGIVIEFKRFFNDIQKYRQYIVYSAQADLRAEVANSYLNRLWWLLEPFFTMMVYVIVFGKAMGRSVENYSTFIFSALLMWNFFNKTLNYSVKLIRNNKDIVTKVYVPKFVLLLSDMVLNLFKLLFSMVVLVVMMLVFKVHIGVNIFLIVPAYLLMVLLAFGIGMICLHFGVYVDDLSYAVGILLTMLMFLSGTFYEVISTLPEPLNTLMMCLNPVAIFIDTMRNALLYNTVANLPTLGIWLIISILLCGIGVHVVYKNENGYVKVV